MDGRMWQGSIRIAGIADEPGSSLLELASRTVKNILQLEKEMKVERSHCMLMPKKPGEWKPRVITGKFHFEGDAMKILRRTQDRVLLSYKGSRVSIFPDCTSVSPRPELLSLR